MEQSLSIFQLTAEWRGLNDAICNYLHTDVFEPGPEQDLRDAEETELFNKQSLTINHLCAARAESVAELREKVGVLESLLNEDPAAAQSQVGRLTLSVLTDVQGAFEGLG